MRWRSDDQEIVDCWCGWHIDATGMDPVDLSIEIKQHHLSLPETHYYNEPRRSKLVGKTTFGFFVDDYGELWHHTRHGWVWLAGPAIAQKE